MQYELAVINRPVQLDEVKEAVFLAEKLNFYGCFLQPIHLSVAQQFPLNIKLGVLINFPYGNSTSTIRVHAILESIRFGAKVIDISINSGSIASGRWKVMKKDLLACSILCKEKRLHLRAMVETKLLDDKQILHICSALKEANIYDVIISSGTMAENFSDNIIMADKLSKYADMRVILTGALTQEHMKLAEKSDIFGIRFCSTKLAEKVFGV